jgi:hypothetical protein
MTLRDELVEARDKVRRQIEIMSDGASGDAWWRMDRGLRDQLNKTLAELEREIVRQDGIDAVVPNSTRK